MCSFFQSVLEENQFTKLGTYRKCVLFFEACLKKNILQKFGNLNYIGNMFFLHTNYYVENKLVISIFCQGGGKKRTTCRLSKLLLVCYVLPWKNSIQVCQVALALLGIQISNRRFFFFLVFISFSFLFFFSFSIFLFPPGHHSSATSSMTTTSPPSSWTLLSSRCAELGTWCIFQIFSMLKNDFLHFLSS